MVEKVTVIISEDLTGVAGADMTFTAVRAQDTEDEMDISALSDDQINAVLDGMAARTGFGPSAARAFSDLAHKLRMSVKDLERASTVERVQVR
jgi:hypothetical protein